MGNIIGINREPPSISKVEKKDPISVTETEGKEPVLDEELLPPPLIRMTGLENLNSEEASLPENVHLEENLNPEEDNLDRLLQENAILSVVVSEVVPEEENSVPSEVVPEVVPEEENSVPSEVVPEVVPEENTIPSKNIHIKENNPEEESATPIELFSSEEPRSEPVEESITNSDTL